MISRIMYIFISSTFKDMKQERQRLSDIVYPKVRDYALKSGIYVNFVDLREGISDEESEITKKTIEICLNEVRKSRPFFIGIVGHRYGWIPNLNDQSIEIKEIKEFIKPIQPNYKSATELEIDYFLSENKELNLEHHSFFLRDERLTNCESKKSGQFNDFFETQSLNKYKINNLRKKLTNTKKSVSYFDFQDFEKKLEEKLKIFIDHRRQELKEVADEIANYESIYPYMEYKWFTENYINNVLKYLHYKKSIRIAGKEIEIKMVFGELIKKLQSTDSKFIYLTSLDTFQKNKDIDNISIILADLSSKDQEKCLQEIVKTKGNKNLKFVFSERNWLSEEIEFTQLCPIPILKSSDIERVLRQYGHDLKKFNYQSIKNITENVGIKNYEDLFHFISQYPGLIDNSQPKKNTKESFANQLFSAFLNKSYLYFDNYKEVKERAKYLFRYGFALNRRLPLIDAINLTKLSSSEIQKIHLLLPSFFDIFHEELYFSYIPSVYLSHSDYTTRATINDEWIELKEMLGQKEANSWAISSTQKELSENFNAIKNAAKEKNPYLEISVEDGFLISDGDSTIPIWIKELNNNTTLTWLHFCEISLSDFLSDPDESIHFYSIDCFFKNNEDLKILVFQNDSLRETIFSGKNNYLISNVHKIIIYNPLELNFNKLPPKPLPENRFAYCNFQKKWIFSSDIYPYVYDPCLST